MPALRHRRWTAKEVERLIDEREGLTPRYELIDGDLLVTPAPSGRHQRIEFRLAVLLDQYVARTRIGEIRLGPGDVKLAPETHFEPDIFVVPAINGRLPRADGAVTRLLLAAEVLSPGSARHDRITKRRFFQKANVPDFWVVDGETEAFEIWHPQDQRAELVDTDLTWRAAGASEAFELDVRQFFSDLADEPN